MLTPQEVSNGKLEKALLGGYDISSVDKFLEQVTQDYTSLYRENGILKTKMKVLVDKVEEYRSTEDAMRMALLQAEQTAREIIASAEAKRDSIEAEVAQRKSELLHEAETEAEERRTVLRQEVAVEEAALLRARRATSEYLDKLKSAMSEYAETVSRVYDFVEPLPPEAEPAPPAKESAEEAPPAPAETPENGGVTQDTVANIVEIIDKAFSSLEEKEKAAEEADPDSTISKLPKIDYNNLQFGENYSPTKK